MKREIKFRGKKTSTGEWVYGYLAMVDDQPSILTDSIEWIDGSELRGICWDWVDPDTVGQFTGLHDAAGKEIYEGDIIKGRSNNIRHVISYNESRGAFTATLIDAYMNDTDCLKTECNVEQYWLCETEKVVKGNVYDNPELLKGGNQ